MATETEIAWAAGLIDGERSICVTKKRSRNKTGSSHYYSIYIRVNMVHLPALQELQRILGGTICPARRSAKFGRPQWVWSAAARKAQQTLRLLLPYLRVKRQEAQLALRFYEVDSGSFGFYEKLKAELSEAKNYGWAHDEQGTV